MAERARSSLPSGSDIVCCNGVQQRARSRNTTHPEASLGSSRLARGNDSEETARWQSSGGNRGAGADRTPGRHGGTATKPSAARVAAISFSVIAQSHRECGTGYVQVNDVSLHAWAPSVDATRMASCNSGAPQLANRTGVSTLGSRLTECRSN